VLTAVWSDGVYAADRPVHGTDVPRFDAAALAALGPRGDFFRVGISAILRQFLAVFAIRHISIPS